MTLDQSRRGMEIEIVGIGDEVGRSQLMRFGIAEGAKVICEEKLPMGPIILRSKRQEIAIGRQLAMKITINQLHGQPTAGKRNIFVDWFACRQRIGK